MDKKRDDVLSKALDKKNVTEEEEKRREEILQGRKDSNGAKLDLLKKESSDLKKVIGVFGEEPNMMDYEDKSMYPQTQVTEKDVVQFL